MEKIRSLLWSIGMLTTLSVGAESTTALSVNGQGGTADGISDRPVISADGRFVAYHSKAADLVPGDNNNENDIFLHERATNTVTRISLGINGSQSNGGSTSPSISQDGRYVAFESQASNLVANDTTGTNGYQDIFVHDRITAVTVRVSVSSNGVAANGHGLHPAISGDGRFVVFISVANNLVAGDANNYSDVFLHDRDPDQNGVFDENNGVTVRISPSGNTVAAGNSNYPSISRNGQYVAYSSTDATLVPNDNNGVQDIFVYNIQTGATERVSVASSGQQANAESLFTSLSDDARYVAFISGAINLVSGDTNGKNDVFVRDRIGETTVRASVSNSGAQSGSVSTSPVISGDGRYVGFASQTSSLIAKPIHQDTLAPVRFDAISTATGGGGGGGDLPIPFTIYRRDLNLQKTVRISSTNSGAAANDSSVSLSLSADGMVAAFASAATNLDCVTDANSVIDVFVRDLNPATPASCETPSSGGTAKGGGGGMWAGALLALFIFYGFLRHRSLRMARQ